MSKFALVTGANGFVGRTLCQYLLSLDWEIVGLDKVVGDCPKKLDYPLIGCDISDPSPVDALFKKYREVTHIFHLAAITFVPDSKLSPVATMDVNLNGTINIIESMKRNAPTARMLFVSSSEIYGPPLDLPVTESHPFNPQNPYAISKLAADLYCGYESSLGTDIVRVRPFNHSGAGQSSSFVLSDFCRQVVEIEAGLKALVLSVGNLSAARDFSHVDDVVRAYHLAAVSGEKGKVYNVCSGKSVVIGEMLKEIIKQTDQEITVERSDEKYRPLDVPEICGSHSLLSDKLGWQPEKSNADIISDLMQYWRCNLIPQ